MLMRLNQTKTIISNIPLIEKELVSDLKFPTGDVLEDKLAVRERMYALHRATSLGNIHQRKVTIVFEDAEGLKSVRTTIWAISDRKVILKEGRSIPVQRVHSVSSNNNDPLV